MISLSLALACVHRLSEQLSLAAPFAHLISDFLGRTSGFSSGVSQAATLGGSGALSCLAMGAVMVGVALSGRKNNLEDCIAEIQDALMSCMFSGGGVSEKISGLLKTELPGMSSDDIHALCEALSKNHSHSFVILTEFFRFYLSEENFPDSFQENLAIALQVYDSIEIPFKDSSIKRTILLELHRQGVANVSAKYDVETLQQHWAALDAKSSSRGNLPWQA